MWSINPERPYIWPDPEKDWNDNFFAWVAGDLILALEDNWEESVFWELDFVSLNEYGADNLEKCAQRLWRTRKEGMTPQEALDIAWINDIWI